MRIALTGPVQIGALRPWLTLPGDGPAPPPGRGGTPVTQLARGLLERGHDLTVVTLDSHVGQEVVLDGPRLRVRVGPYRPQHRSRDAFRLERAYVASALSREKADVVHAHWTYEYALAALSAGLPTLITVRDWAPTILRYQPTPYRAVRLAMNVRTLMTGRHFTAASPYMQQRLRRWLRTDVPVVPNALDDEAFRPRQRPFPTESPLLLAVNNGFSRRKNITTLLEAFARVRRNRPDARLALAGNGFAQDESAHRWATERGFTDGVQFHGPIAQTDLPDLFQAADLFVHPALEESFGMVLVEAMSQGLPVLAGRSAGAVPWVLNGGRAGYLTDVRSPDALCATILHAIDDADTLAAYSRDGYEHARRHFRLSVVLDTYLELYSRVAESNST